MARTRQAELMMMRLTRSTTATIRMIILLTVGALLTAAGLWTFSSASSEVLWFPGLLCLLFGALDWRYGSTEVR